MIHRSLFLRSGSPERPPHSPGSKRMSPRRPSSRYSSASRLLRTERLEDRRLLAVTPELLDLNLAGDGSDPRDMVAIGEIDYFVAETSNARLSLWRSDGSTAGTYQLREFYDSSRDDSFELTNVNGVLFFAASEPSIGNELWKSDGTVAGTKLVKDIRPNQGSSYADDLVNVNGVLYFTANDGVHGEELWMSDGTAAGTVLVKDIRPGSVGSEPNALTAVGSTLFFSAKPGSSAATLWRSQGTAANTIALAGATPEHLTNVGGTLYFKADDVGTPDQLFRSDGTLAGTVRAATITVGDGLINMNGVLYFRGTVNGVADELWRTDGTVPGTIRLATFPTNTPIASARELTAVGNMLYFVGPGQQSYVASIWKSDGTLAGTTSLSSQQFPLGFNKIDGLTNVGGTLYFRGQGNSGSELWKSDGSAAGTTLVKDINPTGNGLGGSAFQRTNIGSELYFAANDGATGFELWKSDGSAGGTAMIVDLPPASLGSNPQEFTQVNDRWYFRADVGGGTTGLWTSDGTIAGTRRVVAADGSMRWPMDLFNAGGVLYFTANGASGQRSLWRTDETEAGTVAMPGSNNLEFRYPTYTDGVLFFGSGDPDYPVQNFGRELWKYDITTEMATRLTDIYPGRWSSQPRNITSYNGDIYFAANDGTHGFELWKHDGASATLVKDLSPGADSTLVNFNVTPEPFPIINGVMLFVAGASSTGSELWRSDGTEAGTYLVKDIYPGTGGSTQTLEDFTYEIVSDVMYFWAYEPVFGQELWRTDGTAAGTFLVKDISPGSGHSSPLSLTNLEGTLYFTANDGTHGYQLWKSDGTEAGTLMVADAFNGEHLFSDMRNIDGTLWFVANDGLHGTEIWTSDGTAAGTQMLVDFTPGPKSTPVGEFLNINGVPFVTLNDGQSGYELWRFAENRPGDFNRDGVVNGNDFLAWQRAYGSTVVAGSGADGDGDGFVGAGDLDLWKGAFDEPPALVASAAAVAESSSAVAFAMEASSVEEAFDDEPAFSGETVAIDDDHFSAREAIFAAGDFSRLYGVGHGGEVESLLGRRRSWVGRRR